MSKRCELKKEYFKANGNYKGVGKFKDNYVEWLENKLIDLSNKEQKCKCKNSQFTRMVTIDCEPLCGRCGNVI